jgi:hypothetical protein
VYGLTGCRRRYEAVPRFAIFSVGNTNFVELGNQFGCTFLEVFFQILDCYMKERLRYLQVLIFLRDTFTPIHRFDVELQVLFSSA